MKFLVELWTALSISLMPADLAAKPPVARPPATVSTRSAGTRRDPPVIRSAAFHRHSPGNGDARGRDSRLVSPSGGDFGTGENFLEMPNVGARLPDAGKFRVTANGTPREVKGVGFKRRVLYAPLRRRDLRIVNSLYLELARPDAPKAGAVPDGAAVEVRNPDGTLSATPG